MARNDISIDQLANAITQAVQQYTDDVQDAISVAVHEEADACAKEIQANSPRQRGDYAKGWRIVREDKRGYTRRVIWNKEHYRLVHLLEKGHAKKGGGRVAGIPHVGPAERRYVERLQERIKRIIRGGG